VLAAVTQREELLVGTASIRWSSLIPGLICLVVGLTWALQGVGLIGGSLMSGQALWIGIGVVVAVIGLLLAYRGLFRRRSPV
jgi:hypothetical protein